MKRNKDGDAEWIIEHVYVRGMNGSLAKLARLPGIDCIRKEVAPPDWISQLILEEQAAVASRPMLHDFVRVLTGPCARLCGTVIKSVSASATVLICMPTKNVRVYTSWENVQLIDCPVSERNFFFQSDLF
jgi:hypothetical protein